MMNHKKICLIALPLLVFSACNNSHSNTNSNSNTTTNPTTIDNTYHEDLSKLSSDQQIFESFEFHGGSSQVVQNIPKGGGKLVSGKNAVMAPTYAITTSLLEGEQTELLQNKNLAPDLTVPTGTSQTKILQNGAILLTAKNGARKVSLTQDGEIHADILADDQKTVAISYRFSNFESTSLSGAMSDSDDELLAAFPVEDWMKWGNFNAIQKWDSGSAYFTYSRTYNDDTVYPSDCDTAHAKASAAGAAVVNACPNTQTADLTSQVLAQKVEDVFPFVVGDGSGHINASFLATDGTIATIQGMRAWVAKQPDLFFEYRVFFEAADGHVYTASLRKSGTKALTARVDSTYDDVEIRLNAKAVSSIQKGLIAGTQGSGDETGDDLNHKTADLFGIGGHGVNGALSAADLRAHYNVPNILTGAGQTVVLIGATAEGDFEDDLRIYSQANHLPICDSEHANPLNKNADSVNLTPCFQHIRLTDSAVALTENGVAAYQDAGGEIALDIEMAHALAPGANIVLITGNSLIDALQTAANFSEVASISSSFSYDICADQNNIDPNRACANKDDLPIDGIEKMLQAAQIYNGVPIFVASGDAGNFENPENNPAYPTVSQYVTAVGGTRVHSVAPISASNADSLWEYAGSGYGVTAMPTFQKALAGNLKASTLGTGLRMVPDVAAVADGQYSAVAVYHDAQWMIVGGTSVASPVWAGITALIAHAMVINNPFDPSKDPTDYGNFNLSYLVSKTDGGLNGVIYSLGAQNSSSESGFVDIISGTNDLLGRDLPYMQAASGFDSVSGLGTPDVSLLSAAFIGKMKQFMPSPIVVQ